MSSWLVPHRMHERDHFMFSSDHFMFSGRLKTLMCNATWAMMSNRRCSGEAEVLRIGHGAPLRYAWPRALVDVEAGRKDVEVSHHLPGLQHGYHPTNTTIVHQASIDNSTTWKTIKKNLKSLT